MNFLRPALFIPCSFIRSFVSARCLSILLCLPFDPAASLHRLVPLPPIIRVSSIPSSHIWPSLHFGRSPLPTFDRHRYWRKAKFSISFSLVTLVFPPRFFFLSPKVVPLFGVHPLLSPFSVSHSPGVSCSTRPPLHGVPARSRRNIVT